MQETEYITIISSRKKIVLGISTILYILATGKYVDIHVSGGAVYKTRMTLAGLADTLGDNFIKAHRGCIVSVYVSSKYWQSPFFKNQVKNSPLQ